MNILKKANLLMMSWVVEALNKTDDDAPVVDGIDFAVGGQAVVEGVMMRSPNSIVISVRKPDGSIKVKKKHFRTMTQRHKWLNVPIVRGVINLVEMMFVGSEAINYSAAESMEDDPAEHDKHEQSNSPKSKTSAFFNKSLSAIMYVVSFVFALGLSIGLFKFLPLAVATWASDHNTYIQNHYIVFNLIDGVLKMSIFLSYIFILSKFKAFHRIFEYHGAEHKSIFNYESHEPLTVANAKKQIRFHPRCGTSFILIVFLISIVFYTFVPKQPDFWVNFSLRLVLLPVIAGISYEYLKISAKHADNRFVKALIAPGLWFQRLTTQEPNDEQLAVGLQSLQAALEMEETN